MKRRWRPTVAGCRLRPDYLDAINNAGIVLQELGRATRGDRSLSAAAAGAFRRMRTPTTIWERRCLADGRPAEARGAFEQALGMPTGISRSRLQSRKRLARARQSRRGDRGLPRRACCLRPDDADAFSQLVYHRALACAWDNREADQAKLLEMVRREFAFRRFICSRRRPRQPINCAAPSNGSRRSSRRGTRSSSTDAQTKAPAFVSAISPAIFISTPRRG